MMEAQFYKIAVSLTQKLKCSGDAFVKMPKSIRKYRRIFLSDHYLYIMSEDKIKAKLSIGKMDKIFESQNSAQFVILAGEKHALIDNLLLRDKIIRQILNLNSKTEVIQVKEPLLDDYVQGIKEDMAEDAVRLNMIKLKNSYVDYGETENKPSFDDLYRIEEIISKEDLFWLVIVSETKYKEQIKKKKKNKNGPAKYTVKIYPKQLLGNNKTLAQRIMNERNYLQEIMSPYFPTLYKCMISKTYAYSMCDFYNGQYLESYIKNQTINKNNLKILLGQIATSLGQLHECGIIYDSLNLKGVFVTNQGFVVLNELGKCKRIASEYRGIKREQQYEKEEETGSPDEDWFQFGQLIFEIKEGKPWKECEVVPEYKEKQLTNLLKELLDKQPQKRLGHINDYYEVLGHEYFKGISKKELAKKKGEPLRKFFQNSYQVAEKDKRVEGLLELEDWSINDNYLKNYEYCRQLED